MNNNEERFLWSFYFDYGRSGGLEGLFVATEKEIEDAIGKEVCFGEALGKHSEVYGTVDKGEITKIDISAESVNEVSKFLGNTWSGWNPLHYTQSTCDECGETMSDDEWYCSYREEFDRELCDECVDELEKEED